MVSSKLHDSRNGKPLSHRVILPPFPWSQHFNGHNKSNNEAVRISNRSTCQGRWVRIRSNASFIGGGNEDFADLDSLTYDNSLVPAGQLIYKLPEIESSSSALINQQCCQQNLSSAACPTASLPPAGRNPAFFSSLMLSRILFVCSVWEWCVLTCLQNLEAMCTSKWMVCGCQIKRIICYYNFWDVLRFAILISVRSVTHFQIVHCL